MDESHSPPNERGEYAIVLSTRALVSIAVAVIATVTALRVIDRAGAVLGLLGAALTAAVIAAPIVRGLTRWMPRGAALAVVTVIGIIGTIALIGVVAWDLDRQAQALADSLHDAIGRLDPASDGAQLVSDLDLSRRIDSVLDGAAARLVVGDTQPLAAAALMGKVVLVGVLAAFMVAGGKQAFEGAVRFVRRASIREQLHVTTATAFDRAGSYLRRTLAVSMVHGAAAAAFAAVTGLPGPIVLGAWVALTSTVPVIGGLLAWLPIVTLATLDHMPLALTIAFAVVAIVIDRVVRGRWVHNALHVGPVLALIGIGVGHALVGVPGALMGLLVVSLIAGYLTNPDDLGDALVDLVEDPVDRATPGAVDNIEDDSGAISPAPEVVTAETRPDNQRIVRLGVSARTITTLALMLVAFATIVAIVGVAQPLIVWFSVATFVAFGVDRPVSIIHRRWNVPRPIGTSIVLGGLLALVGIVVLVAGPSITDSAATITKEAPETVESMESLPIVGRLLENADAADKVEEWLATLPERMRDSDATTRLAHAAGDGLIGIGWTIAMLLAILWDGPRLVDAVRRRIPVRRRQRAIRFGRAAYLAFSNVVAAAAFVAILNGTVVMLLAIALGIPMAPVLGMWAALWNVIPQIDGFVGAVPLVALGFAQGPWTGVLAAAIFLTYQLFENHVLQPTIGSRVIQLPPLVVLVGALFGGALFGFVGALMAGPLLGIAKVAVDEYAARDGARIEDRGPMLAEAIEQVEAPEDDAASAAAASAVPAQA